MKGTKIHRCCFNNTQIQQASFSNSVFFSPSRHFSQSWSDVPPYLLGRLTNPEDEDEQTGWEQLPYEEDSTKDQVATVTQLITQVSLQRNTSHVY